MLRGGPTAFDHNRYTYTLLVLDPGIPSTTLLGTLRCAEGHVILLEKPRKKALVESHSSH